MRTYLILTYRIMWCFVSTAKEFNSQRDVVHLGRLTVARTRSQTLSKISWGWGEGKLLEFNGKCFSPSLWVSESKSILFALWKEHVLKISGIRYATIVSREYLHETAYLMMLCTGRIPPWWCNDLNFCQCRVLSRQL